MPCVSPQHFPSSSRSDFFLFAGCLCFQHLGSFLLANRIVRKSIIKQNDKHTSSPVFACVCEKMSYECVLCVRVWIEPMSGYHHPRARLWCLLTPGQLGWHLSWPWALCQHTGQGRGWVRFGIVCCRTNPFFGGGNIIYIKIINF